MLARVLLALKQSDKEDKHDKRRSTQSTRCPTRRDMATPLTCLTSSSCYWRREVAMTYEDFCNICLIVFVMTVGFSVSWLVFLVYVIAMFFGNERDK